MRNVCLLFVLAAVCSGAQAQETRVFAGSGVTFPAGPGDIADWWDSAPTFDIGVGRRIADRFEITLSAGRTSLPVSKDKLLVAGADLEIEGGDFSISSVRVGILTRLERGTWFRPYAHVGVGLFRIAVDQPDIEVRNPQTVCPSDPSACELRFTPAERPDETAPGIQISAGVLYYLTERVQVYGEPAYHIIFSDDRVGIFPLRLGVVLTI